MFILFLFHSILFIYVMLFIDLFLLLPISSTLHCSVLLSLCVCFPPLGHSVQVKHDGPILHIMTRFWNFSSESCHDTVRVHSSRDCDPYPADPLLFLLFSIFLFLFSVPITRPERACRFPPASASACIVSEYALHTHTHTHPHRVYIWTVLFFPNELFLNAIRLQQGKAKQSKSRQGKEICDARQIMQLSKQADMAVDKQW